MAIKDHIVMRRFPHFGRPPQQASVQIRAAKDHTDNRHGMSRRHFVYFLEGGLHA
jgi:hypothetical protein